MPTRPDSSASATTPPPTTRPRRPHHQRNQQQAHLSPSPVQHHLEPPRVRQSAAPQHIDTSLDQPRHRPAGCCERPRLCKLRAGGGGWRHVDPLVQVNGLAACCVAGSAVLASDELLDLLVASVGGVPCSLAGLAAALYGCPPKDWVDLGVFCTVSQRVDLAVRCGPGRHPWFLPLLGVTQMPPPPPLVEPKLPWTCGWGWIVLLSSLSGKAIDTVPEVACQGRFLSVGRAIHAARNFSNWLSIGIRDKGRLFVTGSSRPMLCFQDSHWELQRVPWGE
jgi:hypothetical protein